MQINEYLQLSWMDILLSGLKWQVMKLEVDGYRSEKKIQLIWWNRLEVAQSIFRNPIFSQSMSFDPIKVWNGDNMKYGEWFMADEAFCIQSSLPMGATIVSIIATSDKTPVMRQTGGLEMHPLLITIGNIDSDVHMKMTSHTWQCVTFMPVTKFNTHSDYQTILQLYIWYKCIDIVITNLKHMTNIGAFLVNPSSNTQYCFIPLVEWIVDLPEQQMIACISKNVSLIMMAMLKQFGDAQYQPSHTGLHILKLIHDLSLKVDPWNIDHFQKLCKESLLMGIHLLCWHDWMNSEEVVGNNELDAHYKVHHQRITVYHFTLGVSYVKQMTRQEYHDIQHTIVAMIAGAAPPEMV
ncbi:hypothetical protein HD554DRAFT_2034992 [Boletus coccyginus]|nr:hypothetical protein HD554DRAFT_2034992 [Boletus coccyginus]